MPIIEGVLCSSVVSFACRLARARAVAELCLKVARPAEVTLSCVASIAGFKLVGGESMLASRSGAALLGLAMLRLLFGACDGGAKSTHPRHERFRHVFSSFGAYPSDAV